MAMLGLRGKSLLALLLSCALALIPAALVAWQGVSTVRDHFGLAFARNHALLHRQQIVGPAIRELALARRLADSELARDWLSAPDDAEKRDLFFKEAENYRRALRDHVYFVADSDANFYYNDSKSPMSVLPRYKMDISNASDGWYFATLRSSEPYNLNIERNTRVNASHVWINVPVQTGGISLGIIGTGIELTTFLADFEGRADEGVTTMMLNRDGAIQAHPDRSRIAYMALSEKPAAHQTILGLLAEDKDREAFKSAMERTEAHPDEPVDFWATFDGKRQLVVVAYAPELQWYVVSVADLGAAQVIDPAWATQAAAALIGLLAALLVLFGYAVERLVLSPIRRLQSSAQAISAGRYDTVLPSETNDEIGELNRAFGVMAAKVRSHTQDLEHRVRERTRELEAAHARMAAAHKQINDSIEYASLIQRAILPDRQMAQSLGPAQSVYWRPRDVVGGDFYVFIPDGQNCLLGVVDCAGHGVAGALMTMLARSAIDHAVKEVGAHDPAAILARTDATLRATVQDTHLPGSLATNMDAGLVYVDRAAGTARFAGAKMSLFAATRDGTQEFSGGRRALGERRVGDYANTDIPLSGRTFHLVTDGVLDQAGGEHGYGFGNRRLADLLQQVAALPLNEQARIVEQALVKYQGSLPQRDDITVLSFRFE